MADAGWYGPGVCSDDLFTLFKGPVHGAPPWESSTPPLGSRPSVAIVVVVLGALLPVASRVAVVVRVLAVTAVVLVRVRGSGFGVRG